MNSWEAVFFWSTALMLAASFFTALLSLRFGKEKPAHLSELFVTLAFALLTLFSIIRWARTGHPPFVSRFESMVASIWFLLLLYQFVRLRLGQALSILAPLSLFAMLLLGWSSSLSHEASPLSASLTNVWLFIHASFATAGAATFLMGSSFSVVFLRGKEAYSRLPGNGSKLPRHSALPSTVTNFLLFGLILWGVMLVSGSIWANSAWGRYWAWDPIELWSLVSWLLYALVYHIRLAYRISPRIFSILNIVAAFIVVFSLWGIQYVYSTIHSYG